MSEEEVALLCTDGHSLVTVPPMNMVGHFCDSCGAEEFVFFRCCSECEYELCDACYVNKNLLPGAGDMVPGFLSTTSSELAALQYGLS